MSNELQYRIRVFHAEHRLSQAELDEAIGLSRKTIREPSTTKVGRFVPSTVIALEDRSPFQRPVEDVFFLDDAG